MQYLLEDSVVVGDNVTIEPFAIVRGNSVLCDGAVIGSGSVIVDSIVGSNCVVTNSRIVDSRIGNNTTVGPYAHIRNNSTIADGCRIGNFVEIKNSTIGHGTKASHLSYIGDAIIGQHCNIGCGVIFVNYDGKHKHVSKLGDRVFVGCNSNIVSPVNIGNRVYIACSSTVNVDLDDNSFVIGRSQLTIKHNYSDKYIPD